MKEPFTVRISDAADPKRGEKFEQILRKRGANATDILRHLVDAYIESDGKPAFPVVLQECPNIYHFKSSRRRATGRG